MNVQDIAKAIKREPAEIIKKLFMMGTMVNQNQSLDEETIELILMDYGIEAVKKKSKKIKLISNVYSLKRVILMKKIWLSVHQLLQSWVTLTW